MMYYDSVSYNFCRFPVTKRHYKIEERGFQGGNIPWHELRVVKSHVLASAVPQSLLSIQLQLRVDYFC
jgi:hypothetical protein